MPTIPEFDPLPAPIERMIRDNIELEEQAHWEAELDRIEFEEDLRAQLEHGQS